MAPREGELRVPEASRSPGSQQGEEKFPGEVREAELGSCSGQLQPCLKAEAVCTWAKESCHPYLWQACATPKPVAILLGHALVPGLGTSWSKQSKPVSGDFQSFVSKHQTRSGRAKGVGGIMSRTWPAVWRLDGAELSGLHPLPTWGAWFLRALLEEPAVYLYL